MKKAVCLAALFSFIFACKTEVKPISSVDTISFWTDKSETEVEIFIDNSAKPIGTLSKYFPLPLSNLPACAQEGTVTVMNLSIGLHTVMAKAKGSNKFYTTNFPVSDQKLCMLWYIDLK